MKRLTRTYTAAVLAAILVIQVLGAHLAEAASVTANATAQIVNSLSVYETQGLNFGLIFPGTSNSKIIVSTTGSVSTTGNAVHAGGAANGEFEVNGPAGAFLYSASIADKDITLTRGSASMDVTLTNPNPSLAFVSNSPIRVGGTLNVKPNQAAGVYNGSYVLTVNFY